MSTPETQGKELRLVDYVRPLASRKWMILAIVIVVTGATYVYYDRQPPVYQTSTQIFVGDSSSSSLLLSSSTLVTTDRTTRNQATLLTSTAVASRVVRALKLNIPPGAVLGSVTATPSQGADFIVITAKRSVPAEAAAFANEFAKAFIALRSDQTRRGLQATLSSTRKQLAALSNRASDDAERSDLSSTLRRLQLAVTLPTGGVQQLDPAGVPGVPLTPQPKRNATFAAVLALIAAIGLAFGLERFDRRLKRIDDIDALYGLPLLAVLPHSTSINPVVDGEQALGPDFREAFRQLRTNIQLEALNVPIKRILITSAIPGEGKSTVVRNLALAFSEFGQRVTVVDSDLRRPTQHTLLHTDNERGLTTVMTGEDTLGGAMSDISFQAKGLETLAQIHAATVSAPPSGPVAEAVAGNGHAEASSALRLLAAGPTPANPQAVLSARRTQDLLDEVAADADIVLIDSPPMLVVSDAIALAGQVDAIIIVARIGLSTRDGARRITELLDRVPHARPIGVVINDLAGLEGGDYSYGYRGYGADA